MPVCKFYVRGNCRKGNNCNFDHVLPHEDYGARRSGGTSIMRGTDSSEAADFNQSSSYDDYSSNKRYGDYRYSNYDRNTDGQYVTVNNEYYFERQNYRQYDQTPKQYGNQSHQTQRYQNDKYHYDPRQNQYKSQAHQKQPNITIEEVNTLLKSDIDVIENGHIWPLTSFCLIKLFGSLEDWFDYSPEEMRFALYIAKATNTLDGYKASYSKIVSEAESVRKFYKATPKNCSKLKAYLKQDPNTIHPLINNELDFSQINFPNMSISSNTSDFINTEATSFGLSSNHRQTEDMEMASAPKTENVFGPFQSLAPSNASFFSQETKQPSVFPQNQNEFSNNIFGSVQNPTQPSESVFGKNQISFASVPNSRANVFNKSNEQSPRNLTNLFPRLKNTDLAVEILSTVWCGDSPYSRTADLTEEEIEQFKAPTFTMGKIPLVPPSRELC